MPNSWPCCLVAHARATPRAVFDATDEVPSRPISRNPHRQFPRNSVGDRPLKRRVVHRELDDPIHETAALCR